MVTVPFISLSKYKMGRDSKMESQKGNHILFQDSHIINS